MGRQGRLQDIAAHRVRNGLGASGVAQSVQRFLEVYFRRGHASNKDCKAISCVCQKAKVVRRALVSLNKLPQRNVPPKESRKIRVSFESRYGTCPTGGEANAATTLPKTNKSLLIVMASEWLLLAVGVCSRRSEPAKSTRVSLARKPCLGDDDDDDEVRAADATTAAAGEGGFFHDAGLSVTWSVQMACDRLET